MIHLLIQIVEQILLLVDLVPELLGLTDDGLFLGQVRGDVLLEDVCLVLEEVELPAHFLGTRVADAEELLLVDF